LATSSGQAKWFEISHKIEEFVKADKKLNANVDFYSASTYHTLGIDVDLFTPIFAVSASAAGPPTSSNNSTITA
jgi:citrate synthase